MTHRVSVVCLLALVVAPRLEVRGQDEDRAGDASAVAKRQSTAYVQAFNERKLKDLVSLFTEDGDFAFLQGATFERLEYGEVQGRELMQNCAETFFELYPEARLQQCVLKARLIRPDVMIADVDFVISGFAGDSGPIRGRSVIVWVKDQGAWKIAAERNVSRSPAKK